MNPRWWHGIVAAVAVGVIILWPLSPALSTSGSAVRLYSAVLVVVVCAIIAMAQTVPSKVWTVVTLTSAMAGAGVLVAHLNAAPACVTEYVGRPVVIGRTLLPSTVDYVAKNPGMSSSDLLFDAAGDAARVWTAASIRSCQLWLGWGALASVPLFAAAISASIARRRYWPAAAVPAAAPAASRPGPVPMYDAFISYRHTEPDKSHALAVLEDLESRGHRVAIDFRDFRPNEHFLSEMERCITESRFILCIVTARYLDSDHCEEEAVMSKTLDLAERRKRLVPLIFERVTLPIWLHGLVGIDFTPAATVEPGERLQALIGRPASSERR